MSTDERQWRFLPNPQWNEGKAMVWRRKGLVAIALTLAVGLVGCGGGGDGSGSGGATSYAFVPPVLNSTRVYDETVVDNSNNSIAISYMVTVTTLASSGNIIEQQQSIQSSPTVNGTNYTVPTETVTYNNGGRETGYTYTESDGNPGSCAYAPYEGGVMPPITVGQAWQLNYTRTCNANSPIAYTQSGTVVDVESVTVAAGTYMALKLQSTIVWTDANGTIHTETSTNWLDTATFHSVKQSETFVLSGTAPTEGYAVSREIELQSMS